MPFSNAERLDCMVTQICWGCQAALLLDRDPQGSPLWGALRAPWAAGSSHATGVRRRVGTMEVIDENHPGAGEHAPYHPSERGAEHCNACG